MQKSLLKIGFMPITDHLVLGVSCEHDCRKFKNVDLQPVQFHSWQILSDTLTTGEIDGAFILAPLAIQLNASGVKIKLICLGHREGSVLVVRPDINKVAELKGKIIAIPHTYSTQALLLYTLLTDAGLDYKKDIQIIEIDPSDMLDALKKGNIDSYIVAEPFGSQAEEEFVGKVLTTTQLIKKHHTCCVLVMREEVLDQHHDAVQEVINSIVEAGEFIYKHPKHASRIGAQFLDQKPATVLRALTAQGGRVISWDLLPLVDEFTEIQNDVVDKMKLPLQKIQISNFVMTKYVEHAYANLVALIGKKEKKKQAIEKIVFPIIIFLLFFVGWQLFSTFGLFDRSLLPSPIDVAKAIKELFIEGHIVVDILASLWRVFAGFVLATLFAVPVGLLLGSRKKIEYAFEPFIQTVRTISPIAWIPVAILWFGIGDQPAIFIIFITSIFPILIATMNAVKNIDPLIIKSAVNFGARGFNLMSKVILPAAFPYIVTGLRVTLGIAWVIVVAAEMVGMQSGLGFMILDARNFLRTDLIIAGMVIIGCIGFILDRFMTLLEKKIQKNRLSGARYLE